MNFTVRTGDCLMNADYDVSIIIVNYNGKKYLDILFESLKCLIHSDFEYEIVFVDNASSDGSAEYVREKHEGAIENLTIIPSKENLGFAGGNNLGVANAKGKYIVLLNNDTKPESDWLESLYHYIASRPDVVMVNSKLVFFYDFIKIRFYTRDKIILKREIRINHKPYQIDSKFCRNALCEPDQLVCFGHTEIYIPLIDGGKDYLFEFDPIYCNETDGIIQDENQVSMQAGKTNSLLINKEAVLEKKITLIQNAGSGINKNLDGYDIGFCQEDCEEYNHEYEISNGCGASIIFRKDDFIKCGGFDERFFMYYEDADLSCRMKRDGRKIFFCPDSKIRHVHAGSSGEWSPFFIYHVSKNKLLFVSKNFGKKRFLKYYFGQMLSGIKNKDKSKIKGTQKALNMVIADSTGNKKGHCPHLST